MRKFNTGIGLMVVMTLGFLTISSILLSEHTQAKNVSAFFSFNSEQNNQNSAKKKKKKSNKRKVVTPEIGETPKIPQPIKTQRNETKPKEEPKMKEPKMSAVSPGDWGGIGLAITVEENSVSMEFDCATAEITQKLVTDSSGNFKADGFFIPQTPGPIRKDVLPKRLPAVFEGKVSDNMMTMKITLAQTNVLIGDYSLELGKQVRLNKCK